MPSPNSRSDRRPDSYPRVMGHSSDKRGKEASGRTIVSITPVQDEDDRPTVEMVTALRLMGRNVELPLSTAKRAFTLGSAPEPEVDLTVRDVGVSRLHAVLQRKGPKLRVLDQQSTNGTFFDGRYDPDFEVSPGNTFEVTRRIKLLVLDEQLRLLRARLQWFLGLEAHQLVDDALETVAANTPLLLLGPVGSGQLALAKAIHAASMYRGRDFVVAPSHFATREEQDAKLAHGAGGTIFVDVAGARDSLPNHFVVGLFWGGSRPIIAAPSFEQAEKALHTYARRLQAQIVIPPLNARREDVPRLLDALILQASAGRGLGDPLPLSALGEENVEGLKAVDWSGNIESLRTRAVPRLFALLTNQLMLRRAARALGLKSASSLTEALERINVRVSLKDDDDDHDDGGTPGVGSGQTGEADDLPTPPTLG